MQALKTVIQVGVDYRCQWSSLPHCTSAVLVFCMQFISLRSIAIMSCSSIWQCWLLSGPWNTGSSSLKEINLLFTLISVVPIYIILALTLQLQTLPWSKGASTAASLIHNSSPDTLKSYSNICCAVGCLVKHVLHRQCAFSILIPKTCCLNGWNVLHLYAKIGYTIYKL